MRVEEYFRSLTTELEALKDRVRFLIEDRHWQTDGEWKESVLRQVLRRHLGGATTVGRGFIVSSAGSSHQQDILIFDSSKPVLFRDGDLAFVTPDAVVGVIEVKTRATPALVASSASKLAQDMELVRRPGNSKAFAGIFAFESESAEPGAYLRALGDAAQEWDNRVDFVCLGCSHFIRYWHFNPENERHFYQGWQSYALSNMAAGYFLHNVIDAVNPTTVFRNEDVWFPTAGKQSFRNGEVMARWSNHRTSDPS